MGNHKELKGGSQRRTKEKIKELGVTLVKTLSVLRGKILNHKVHKDDSQRHTKKRQHI